MEKVLLGYFERGLILWTPLSIENHAANKYLHWENAAFSIRSLLFYFLGRDGVRWEEERLMKEGAKKEESVS
jgi:hypothetical protein